MTITHSEHLIPTDLVSDALLADMARQYGTPLYVYDIDSMRGRWDLLRSLLPVGSDIYYSVKANPHPGVVGCFASLGAGLEVVSKAELDTALSTGIAADHIICVGPGKSREFINQAVAVGVGAVVAESARDLRLTREAAMSRGRASVKVWLRINPGRGRARMSTGGDTPFGLPVPEAVEQARALKSDPWLILSGLHAYLGTGVLAVEDVATNTLLALGAMEQVLDQAAIDAINTLDLGGGFGIPYLAQDQIPDWTVLRSLLDDRLAALSRYTAKGCRIAFESGRFLAGPAGVFLARVLDCKQVSGSWFVILDGGTNVFPGYGGSFGLRASPFRFLNDGNGSPVNGGNGPPVTLTLCGPLCTSTDRLAVRVTMPQPSEGDICAFYMAGAYGFSAAPGLFLGHGFAGEVCVTNGRPMKGRGV